MPNAQRAFRFAVFSILTILGAGTARADWLADGNSLASGALGAIRSAVVPDGFGGAIVVWRDFRNFNADIYVQRIDGSGNLIWGPFGTPVVTLSGTQDYPAVLTDGLGGAIVTWHDARSGNNDIYAQHFAANGLPMWTVNGIPICVQPGSQLFPQIASDGNGGAVITWMDVRAGSYDIYAQRVTSAGAIQWLANGLLICNAAGDQYNPVIIADGVGFTIISWFDYRSGNEDIYVQRVNNLGAGLWTSNGVALTTNSSTQWYPSIVSDGANGAIVAWSELRNGTYDIFASRIDAAGLIQWAFNGNSVTSAAGHQGGAFPPSIVADGTGGAIIAWHDGRDGLANHVYAQRMSSFGTSLWTPDGIPVCTAPDAQGYPTLISDAAGGAVIAWHTATGAFLDARAQHINASGVAQWAASGIELAPGPGNQENARIVSDGASGAIVAWEDSRSGASRPHAQRIETRHGFWGRPEPNVDAVADIPNDQGGKVKVNWDASGHDVFGTESITHYSIWRATDEASALAAIANGVAVRRPSELPQNAPTDYYWEWVGTQDAHYRTHYTFSASTRSDSTVQDNGDAAFFVSAHTADPTVFFDSNVMIGHSVDNLAPAAPLALIAQRAGADVLLRWNRVRVPDLRDYAVYRGTSTGVTAVPINFLSSSVDTILIDAGAPATALYYIVTATDVHDNQGASSNEASVAATTDAGGTPSIRALTVLQNYPNPFAGSTDLSIGLPGSGDVSIEVYDVAGRRVRSELIPRMSAGWQRVSLNDRGDNGKPLASGVYFYRVHAGGATVTKKMVIAR